MPTDHQNGDQFSADDRARLWQVSEALVGVRRELGHSRNETAAVRTEMMSRLDRLGERVEEKLDDFDVKLDRKLEEIKKEFVPKGDYTLVRNVFIAILIAIIGAFIGAIQIRTP